MYAWRRLLKGTLNGRKMVRIYMIPLMFLMVTGWASRVISFNKSTYQGYAFTHGICN